MKSKTLTLLIFGSATLAYAAITSANGGSGCCTMGAAAASLKPEAAQVLACSASAELASAEAKVEGANAAACPVMAKAKANGCCASGELTSEVAKAETAECCTEGADCCTTEADCCLTADAEQANTASKGAQAVLASMNAETAPCCGDGGQCGDKSKKETAQATSHLPACCVGTELAQAN